MMDAIDRAAFDMLSPENQRCFDIVIEPSGMQRQVSTGLVRRHPHHAFAEAKRCHERNDGGPFLLLEFPEDLAAFRAQVDHEFSRTDHAYADGTPVAPNNLPGMIWPKLVAKVAGNGLRVTRDCVPAEYQDRWAAWARPEQR